MLAPGQRQLKLDPKQTGDMIKITATGPADRMGRINRALQKDSRLAHDPVAKGFKMDVSEQMALVSLIVFLAPLHGSLLRKGVNREGGRIAHSAHLDDTLKYQQRRLQALWPKIAPKP